MLVAIIDTLPPMLPLRWSAMRRVITLLMLDARRDVDMMIR